MPKTLSNPINNVTNNDAVAAVHVQKNNLITCMLTLYGDHYFTMYIQGDQLNY